MIEDQKFTDRIKDFSDCLKAIEESHKVCQDGLVRLPAENPSFFAEEYKLTLFGKTLVSKSGSERYHTSRKNFPDVTPIEAQEFKGFIDSLATPSCETGGSLLQFLGNKRTKMAKKLVELRGSQAVQQQIPPPSAPPAPLVPPPYREQEQVVMIVAPSAPPPPYQPPPLERRRTY